MICSTMLFISNGKDYNVTATMAIKCITTTKKKFVHYVYVLIKLGLSSAFVLFQKFYTAKMYIDKTSLKNKI